MVSKIEAIILNFLIVFEIINAKISLDLKCGPNPSDITLTHSGIDVKIINNDDIAQFGLNTTVLKEAVKRHLGKKPNNIYFKDPTPWNLYSYYNWEPVKRILKVNSIKLKGITHKPVIVHSQDFENHFNNTIKVNTGISQTVENTLTTTWSNNIEISISQEIEYKLDVLFARINGVTGFSYTSAFGKSVEKTETVVIGTSTNVETELKPGQACKAVLSANKGYLEIEVTYLAYLKGFVAVHYKNRFNGHHFYGRNIDSLMKAVDLKNEKFASEVIKVGFYSDASLKVYEK